MTAPAAPWAGGHGRAGERPRRAPDPKNAKTTAGLPLRLRQPGLPLESPPDARAPVAGQHGQPGRRACYTLDVTSVTIKSVTRSTGRGSGMRWVVVVIRLPAGPS